MRKINANRFSLILFEKGTTKFNFCNIGMMLISNCTKQHCKFNIFITYIAILNIVCLALDFRFVTKVELLVSLNYSKNSDFE